MESDKRTNVLGGGGGGVTDGWRPDSWGEVFWFDKHTTTIAALVAVSAVINLTLCTITGFIGIGWDWDVLLVEVAMQITNFGIAACLHFRRQMLRHERSARQVLVLVLANFGLRCGVYGILLEIVLSPVDSNDGECKVESTDGTGCAEYWYIRTQSVHDFATYSLGSMTADTILTIFSTLNIRAVLKLEQNADALAQVDKERSAIPLMSVAELANNPMAAASKQSDGSSDPSTPDISTDGIRQGVK